MVIALLVLLPETLAAVRAASRDRVQTSLNLALGSAMASIGLTIPVIAVAMIWLEGPLVLGLGATQIVLLGLTVVVGVLTVVPGRATLLQGGVHLVAVRRLHRPRDQPVGGGLRPSLRIASATRRAPKTTNEAAAAYRMTFSETRLASCCPTRIASASAATMPAVEPIQVPTRPWWWPA